MPDITLPPNLAKEWSEAHRWYRGEPEMEAFLAQVQAGHGWSEQRPRALLRWAAANSVQTFGHRRFVVLVSAGFDGPDRWRLWRVATASLRAALGAIARGEESEAAYADGRELLALGDGRPRRWGRPTDEFGSEGAMTALVFPSFAGPAPEAAGTPPSSSPSSPGSSVGPQVPHGGWLTR